MRRINFRRPPKVWRLPLRSRIDNCLSVSTVKGPIRVGVRIFMTASQRSKSVEVFKSWMIYDKIIANNYMFHRQMHAELRALVDAEYQRPFDLLDLGCGDASVIAKTLAESSIRSYTGIDMSEAALEIAATNLSAIGCDSHLQTGDLVEALAADDRQYDIVVASYAIHHFATIEKQRVLRLIRERLTDSGCFVFIDLMFQPNETRDNYLLRWWDYLANECIAHDEEEKTIIRDHMRDCDFPESLDTYQSIANQAGFATVQVRYQDPRSLHAFICCR